MLAYIYINDYFMPTLDELHALAATCPYQFPSPQQADPNGTGLIAIGGDLAVNTLLSAYLQGLFPWFDDNEPIAWWSPEPRCVINPISFRPANSLKRRAKTSDWTVSLNHAFDDVIEACSLPRAYTTDTWIHNGMKRAYRQLHQLGVAFSIEVWQNTKNDRTLIGGLYGLKISEMVFGESMFHTQTDASKIAFWVLNKLGVHTQVALIDCQLENPHLMSLGATVIKRHTFLSQLQEHTAKDAATDWARLRFCQPTSWLLAPSTPQPLLND